MRAPSTAAGLRITTTLDLDDQQAAEAAVAQVLNQPDDPQAALVALDKSGAIRAYVGGRDYNALQVDLARGQQGGGSGRQAGSTFKPFVLAADAESGGTVKQIFPAPARDHAACAVRSVDGVELRQRGVRRRRSRRGHRALHQHRVRPARPASRPGQGCARSPTPPASRPTCPAEPSITLGAGDVSPLELADAYLTFARDGRARRAVRHRQGRDRRRSRLVRGHPRCRRR